MTNVSIVLPTYNRAATIGRAIESVLNQTYPDFELLIVDDGSTDNTEIVVAQYLKDPRVKYYKRKNQGASAARNFGISVGTGDYVAFQDSDDEWLENKLALQISSFAECADSVCMVYGDLLRVNNAGIEEIRQSPDVIGDELFNPETKEFNVFGIGIQTCLIKRSALNKAGNFDTELPRFIDLELFIRLSRVGVFLRLAYPIVRYYEMPGISTNPLNAAIARLKIIEKYSTEANQRPKELAFQYLQVAGCYWKTPYHDEKKRYARKVLFSKQADLSLKLQAFLLLCIPRALGKRLLGR
ncbi:hypothetical protein BK026_08380 [Alteromonas sp. V450]|uniref:glycosyltransferase family 2 protein n=1 Tax=Alteromonas sp. V450 TaxID=1912139 RepID=UPI0008FF14AF|nr:glycosyltransferase [Alteromonas sp. V450]OJF68804.1 hypothetical protein BK026_08380 [Alteromonas sp. V450]